MMRYKQSTLSRNCHCYRIVLFWDNNQVVATNTMTTLMNVIPVFNASEYSSDFRNKAQRFIYVHYFIWFTLTSCTCMFKTRQAR